MRGGMEPIPAEVGRGGQVADQSHSQIYISIRHTVNKWSVASAIMASGY